MIKIDKILKLIYNFSMIILPDLPLEINNIIMRYRGKHPTAELFFCKHCGDYDNLRYQSRYLLSKERYKYFFDIVCAWCIYDLRKD